MSGSLRSASSNTAALHAAKRLAPPGMVIDVHDGIGGLPHFNPDIDVDPPLSVVDMFRLLIGRSEGLLIATPEYAHGLPGAFKNALDWLVGSTVFPGKPIAILNTAPRAHLAQAQVRDILATMAGVVVEEASVTLAMQGRAMGPDEIVADPSLSRQLQEALSRFAATIAANVDRPGRCV